jgi:hypothetical protein
LEFEKVGTVCEKGSVTVVECLERFGFVGVSSGTRVESKS